MTLPTGMTITVFNADNESKIASRLYGGYRWHRVCKTSTTTQHIEDRDLFEISLACWWFGVYNIRKQNRVEGQGP